MKKKVLLSLVVVAVTAIVLDFNKQAQGNSAGSPSYSSGSAYDRGDCSVGGCHTGTPIGSATASITSNIPGTGYVPNTTYTITATANYPSLVKFGFEISAQTVSGTMVGTMTAGTGSQVKSQAGDVWITHTTAGTTGSTGSHTWTFTWTAPAAGTGSFTFYGAFNCANDDLLSTGDHIVDATLPVNESTLGVAEISNKPQISLYPNPIKDVITLDYTLAQTSSVSVKMIDLQGREVAELLSENGKNAGTYKSTFDMSKYEAGVYFVTLSDGNNTVTKKVMIVH